MKRGLFKHNIYLILFLLITTQLYGQLSIGDPEVKFNNSKFDSNYPFMKEWEKSGVQGGIPFRNKSPIRITLNPTNSKGIQEAINTINTQGKPSVILLKKGIYTIDRPVYVKSNVILRGESKNQVFLNVNIRAQSNRKLSALSFEDTTNSGIEDITFEYIPPKPITIYDDRNKPLNRFCGSDCFSNDPEGVRNMYVSFVDITRTSKNCWIDNCVFKNSGTDPLKINGDHITCRNNFIDACFNKGSSGNGYYDIRGNYGLFVNEKVRRIRHFTIQKQAKFNVVINCNIEVDVNFHNGDGGFNLIENNKITSLQWRSWAAFASGGAAYRHKRPGKNNIIFNNTTKGRNNSERYTSKNNVFVFDNYGEPRLLRNSPPKGKTFYPVILEGSSSSNCNTSTTITGLNTTAITKTSITLAFDEINGASAYELRAWPKGQFTGSINTPKAVAFKGGNSSPLTISGLDAGQEYILVLRGLCGVGQSTEISRIDAATVPEAPQCDINTTITGLTATASTKTSITLAFDEINGASSYELRAWHKGQFTGSINTPKAVAFKGGSSSPLTISELDPGQQYTLVLRGLCGVGQSTEISQIDATTKQDKLTDGIYYIQNPQATVRINSPSASVVNQTSTSANSARWEITKVNDYYTIKNLRNNEYLEVPFKACEAGETAQNPKVNLATYKEVKGKHQKWTITKIGSDYFISPLHCDKVIDRPKNNSSLLLWQFNVNNTNQNWSIVKANVASRTLDNNINAKNNTVNIFPNPVVDNTFTILLADDTASEISVFDIQGKQVYQKQFKQKTIGLKKTDLGKTGMYFMQIKQGEATIIKKIILQ